MPETRRFFGNVIRLFFDDRWRPHSHAEYGGDLALIDIRSLVVFSGGCHNALEVLWSNGLRFTSRNCYQTGIERGHDRNSGRSRPWNENGWPSD